MSPPPGTPSWRHPDTFIGFVLGLLLSTVLINEGMRTAPPLPPTFPQALSPEPAPPFPSR